MRALAVILAVLGPAAAGAAECRQALALGLDVSGSVDDEEYDLQMTGLAQALLAPAVQEAFLAYPEAPVDLYVYEWSGMRSQVEVIGWTTVADAADLARVADVLTTPVNRPREPETAVGLGLMHGAEALRARSACWRLTLDISADGKSNTGPRPRDVKGRGVLDGMTVNALVIGVSVPLMAGTRADSIPELSAYYMSEVIGGPDAFIQVALGYHDYREAMEKKLLKELQTLPVGEAPAPPDLRRASLD
jgi:hypothetical protein